jgi:hypothetical protein
VTDAAFSEAFEARLFPTLQVDGYCRLAPLHFGRVAGDVFQLLVLHREQGTPAFHVEYASLLLVEPHAFASFDLGGRFPEDSVYSALPEGLPHAFETVLVDYLTVLRPRLQARLNLTGLMDVALHSLGASGSPHLWFTLAVGHARLGQEAKARGFAQEALSRYRALCEPSTDGSPNVNTTWATKGEQRAELLVDALYTGRIVPLLEGWRSGTIAALGLTAFEP